MEFWGKACAFDTVQQLQVRTLHLGIGAVFHGSDKHSIAVDFHHPHDILVSPLQMEGETSGLVGIRGVFCFVHFDVHITFLFSLQVACIYGWGRHGIGFRGPNILPFLIQMALGGFSGLWLVVVDVFNCEEGPSNAVSGAYGLHPCGFDWVPADGVHTLGAL